jgi:hypothetical protein
MGLGVVWVCLMLFLTAMKVTPSTLDSLQYRPVKGCSSHKRSLEMRRQPLTIPMTTFRYPLIIRKLKLCRWGTAVGHRINTMTGM